MSAVEENPQINRNEYSTSPRSGEVESRLGDKELRKRWAKALNKTLIAAAMALNLSSVFDSDIRKKILEFTVGDIPDVKSFAQKMRENKPGKADIDPTIQAVSRDKEGRQHIVQFLGTKGSEMETRIENVFDPKNGTVQSFIETTHADGRIERVTLHAGFEGNMMGGYNEYKNVDDYAAATEQLKKRDERDLAIVKQQSDARYSEDLAKLSASKQGGSLQKDSKTGTINR